MSNLHADPPHERAMAALKRKGNPFRQQFARNSDDAACSRHHVDNLFADERGIVRELIECYRGQPDRPTSVLPVLGARGAGKTHLLHCLKHGPGVRPQLFITPGTFRVDNNSDSSFLEYLLYQLINVLLSAGEQRGVRPLVYVGEHVTRSVLSDAITALGTSAAQAASVSMVTKIGWKLGLGLDSARQRLADFARELRETDEPCLSLAYRLRVDVQKLAELTIQHLAAGQTRDLKGEFKRRLATGFLHATLLGNETPLADYLTDGFTDVSFRVPPTRAQLTLSLLQTLSEMVVGAKIPIVAAFDQLEELLYGQTDEEIRRSSDSFFGGLVQLMSQTPGLCVVLFVEEGLWNRIVPPLPPHILDRIHEPIHLPGRGNIRSVRLRRPTTEQLTAVVATRVRAALADMPGSESLPASFPFSGSFLADLAKRETVLRLMLQGCCNKLDEMLEAAAIVNQQPADRAEAARKPAAKGVAAKQEEPALPAEHSIDRPYHSGDPWEELTELWGQEVRAAERRLKPVGSLSAATAELQGGLAHWLRVCKSLGVVQGDWRVTDLKENVQVGEHPTYGTLTILEWSNAAGEKRTVGVGMWLGRGVGKLRDLAVKLEAFAPNRRLVNHLILLRPEDDVRLTGKTENAWNEAVAAGHSIRLEPVDLDCFAKLHAFPRWMQQVSNAYPEAETPERLFRFLAEQTEPIMLLLGLPPESAAGARAA